jgi:hypothetical protein
MSVIKAGTTVTTALVLEGNTDGDLIFKTGSSAVTAMSISASGVVTFPATTGFDIASANITNLTATTLTVSASTYLASASGNVGVGTTLSPWGSSSNYKAVQLGGSQYSFFAGNQTTYVYGNAYWDGTNNKYINNGTACSFGVNVSGTYQFNIAASGTAGNNISFTEAVTITATGNLGVGTSSPGYKLDVNTTGGAAATARLIGNDQSNVRLRIENVGSGGRTWEIVGGLPGANNANLSIRDVTGSTTPLTLNASGGLQCLNTIGVGNATPSTSGAGITFPATQSASSDANTLDDYEQGTWSPSVGGTSTYTIQKGQYTKIGDLVVAAFDMQINTIGTGSTTNLSGLPFTSAPAGAPQGIVAPVSYWATLGISVYWLAFRIDESSTSMPNQYTTGAVSTAQIGGAIFQNDTRVIGTLTYYTS